jgi:hypothetical protein
VISVSIVLWTRTSGRCPGKPLFIDPSLSFSGFHKAEREEKGGKIDQLIA